MIKNIYLCDGTETKYLAKKQKFTSTHYKETLVGNDRSQMFLVGFH